MPIFSGYHLAEERPRWPLAYGIPVFGLGYLSAVAATLGGLVVGGDSDSFLPILVPVVGPFIGLATADAWLESAGERALLVACAGLQLTGIGLTALHWALPAKKVLLLDAEVQIRPLLSPTAGGLAATF
jgi:hypothetical protein